MGPRDFSSGFETPCSVQHRRRHAAVGGRHAERQRAGSHQCPASSVSRVSVLANLLQPYCTDYRKAYRVSK